jgi:hypothetical protein
MDFCLTRPPRYKADSCSALELSPPARTILFLKAHDVPNPAANDNGLNLLDLANNFKLPSRTNGTIPPYDNFLQTPSWFSPNMPVELLTDKIPFG